MLLKKLGEMPGIGAAHRLRNLADGAVRILQKSTRSREPLMEDELVR